MRRIICACALVIFSSVCLAADAPYQVGVARVDITPDYPIRLSGFGHRRSESEGVTAHIFAKAIALRDSTGAESILITVDNLGVPDYMRQDVAATLEKQIKLPPERLAISSSHTHTAPMLKDVCPTIFGMPMLPEQQARIDRYTRELTAHLEKVANAAHEDLKPGKLEFALGSANFSINRRTPGGPVDHDLPMLTVKDLDGKLRAIYVSYACHCVTLSNNKISGDWAGFVQETIAKSHPGAIALTSVGCGGDSNPSSGVTGDKVDLAIQQGKEIADEVERLLKAPMTPIDAPVAIQFAKIALAFDKHPTHAEWEEKAKLQDATGYHARVQLARLDRGEKLQTEIQYPIQTWGFGKQLGMVFLGGEVVVDYSLRLKREMDRSRVWINAYSNDVPCYIPSERILKEGGYEGAGAMIYYDRPTKLAPGLEEKIIAEIRRQLPDFIVPPGTEGVAPRSPRASLESIRTKPNLQVELVGSEPLVTSPVAIDWGADGKLWVCEMFDYPTGADQNWQPGGRVKFLEDADGDGQYEKATIFLENLPFPTGITAWGKGVFICAAPDIIYAEDTDNDGKADKIEKLFTGFPTGNYQARVNSLTLGLDNWIYGADGLLGGSISDQAGNKLEIRNRDFRFRPLKGPMETVSGLTQQGRVRDDFGRWFGCDNSNTIFSYPYEERYFRRNPHAPAPKNSVSPKADYDAGRVFPISRALERFNDPHAMNHVTSACGLAVYRDTLLGEEFFGNTFTCEPVHNLVSRLILDGGDSSMKRKRADDEREAEFFASTDNWSRFVQARTGPDGALYIVDMYRFLIEHPRWIAAARLAQLDVRAGADKGRIYRVKSAEKLRPVRDLTKLNATELAAALDSPNGTERDRVQIELLARHDLGAAEMLTKLASEARLPQVRLQAISALDGLGALKSDMLDRALADSDANVRKLAIQFCEKLSPMPDAILKLADDPSPLVRHQLALSLGQWDDSRAGEMLAKLTKVSIADDEMRLAVLSSAKNHCGAILDAAIGHADWINPLVATAAASDDEKLLARALAAVLPAEKVSPGANEFSALASLFDAIDRKHVKIPAELEPRVTHTLAAARNVAADDSADEPAREAALALVGHGKISTEEIDLLCGLLTHSAPEKLREAALTSLRRQSDPQIATKLLKDWRQTSPADRAEIVNLLLSRDEWTNALLVAVKNNEVAPLEISLTDRQRLAQMENPDIRKLAAEIFPAQPASSRAQVIASYQSTASLKGVATSGAEIFAKNCVACHQVAGAGHDVGPSLAALRDKEVDYFVKNILDPNAVVEPRFVNYQITLKDKRSLSAIIKAETPASMALATGGGAVEDISRADIKDIRASKLSMMPEGFEGAINPQQMADLIAFLKSNGAAPKTFPENKPALITAGRDGSLILPATKAQIFGGTIVFETEFKNIGYWQSSDDYAAWTIRVDKAGPFDVFIDYACAEGSAGNAFTLSVGDQKVAGVVAPTGPDWSAYKQIKIGALKLSTGEHRLTVRPDGSLHSAMMDLRTIALAPPGSTPKWPAAAAPQHADELARDAVSVARVILDKSKTTEARIAAANSNPQFAPELIVELSRDLQPGKPQEYERIPWLWRVAIACGKRNDADQIKQVLNVTLPKSDEPLRDWQAVVIGGGIINGISLSGTWPGERINALVADDADLKARWQRAIELSSAMADNEKVASGTRYDALRMLGVESFDKRGEQLKLYLAKDVNAELQAGAAFALADMNSNAANETLLSALTDGKIKPATLGEPLTKKLLTHHDENVREKAKKLLSK